MVIHITRLVDGSRRISHITEVLGMESDVITLQDIFIARTVGDRSGQTATASTLRTLAVTGLQPRCQDKMAAHDVNLPADFYLPDTQLQAVSANGSGQ
jgi:pilus assembly protein CpaF